MTEKLVRIDDVVELARMKAAGELTQAECEEYLEALAFDAESRR